MAKESFESFTPIVCERLRRLRAQKQRHTNARTKAISARDKADAALNELPKGQPKKRDELLADYGESCRKIRDLASKLRDVEGAIDETLDFADQGELFKDPDDFTPPPDPADVETETETPAEDPPSDD